MSDTANAQINSIDDFIQNILDSEQVWGTSVGRSIAALATALICGLVIYLVYRFFYRGIVFSENYNLLLVLVTVVTAFIMNAISANVVLSIGLVGALSIVRFRAAVKDPLDVGFLFWGVAAGVTAGAGMYFTALTGTAVISVIYIFMLLFKVQRKSYLLILRYSDEAEEKVGTQLGTISYKLKNKSRSGKSVELTVEVKVKSNDAGLVGKFDTVEGVEMVTLLEYNGDMMS